MSHDQKPTRLKPVRVSADPQRRQGDTAPVVIDGKAKGGARAAGSAKAGTAGGRGGIMLAALFIIGAAGGGVATALLTRP